MTKVLLTTIAVLVALALLAGVVLGCGAGAEDPTSTQAPTTATTIAPTAAPTDSAPSAAATEMPPTEPMVTLDPALEPIVVPTLPEEIPGYVEEDPETGLHVTGTPVEVDFDSYRLVVSGKVADELSLTYDEIRSLPKITATPELLCPGVFLDTATWSGAPLVLILEMAGLEPDAEEIHLESADGYSVYLPLDRALLGENFLAYELKGETLPVLHGFPLRAVFPDELGAYWIKWLVRIEVE